MQPTTDERWVMKYETVNRVDVLVRQRFSA